MVLVSSGGGFSHRHEMSPTACYCTCKKQAAIAFNVEPNPEPLSCESMLQEPWQSVWGNMSILVCQINIAELVLVACTPVQR